MSRTVLSPTIEADLEALRRLWARGEVMRHVGFPEGLELARADVQAWFEQVSRDGRRSHFTVRSPEGDFCGEVYYELDPEHRRAGLDIKLLPRCQGKGLARAALDQVIARVFQCHEDVEAVWTEPHEDNAAARRLYERCGLVEQPRPDDLGLGAPYWELSRPSWEARRTGSMLD
ncbi:MAG: GNAT family N-acetyltransferase [Nitriliruptorales bacterium]|nr:GNAT family N-acetyltransferase [Nitriliruptorales bacterium]